MKSLYLLINISCISIPFLFSFDRRLDFVRRWYALWPAVLMTASVFIAWDVLYTHWGVWGFNQKYLSGLMIINLPVEEWLFFICVPYACVFTYHCLNLLVKRDWLAPWANWMTAVLIALLFVVAFFNLDRIYTSVTFIATAVFLLLQVLCLKNVQLSRYYFAYLLLLIPFLIVNGILTGSFLEQPVVWYNDCENTGLRVFTIPVEDFVYAFLMILMNVTIYESVLKRRHRFDMGAVSHHGRSIS